MRYLLPFALLPLLLTSVACAQNVTREYDVRHLLIDIVDFNDAPVWDLKARDQQSASPTTQRGGGLFGGGVDDQPTRDRAALVGNLTRAARVMCDGAAGANVTEVNGRLIVTAPADRQDRVKAAIDAATGDLETQVNIASRVIELPIDQIAKLDPEIRALLDRAMISPREPRIISEADALYLLKLTAPKTGGFAANSGPRVTLFNGQRAYVLVTTQRAYVADHQPVAGKPGQFEPVAEVVDTGFCLDVRAHAAGDVVSLQLHAQVAQLLELTEKPWPQAPAGSNLKIQEPVQRILEANRLATLKSGQWLLLALPATDPKLADPKATHLLLVQPNVITQKLNDIPPAHRER